MRCGTGFNSQLSEKEQKRTEGEEKRKEKRKKPHLAN
jgi:hypothetical protein